MRKTDLTSTEQELRDLMGRSVRGKATEREQQRIQELWALYEKAKAVARWREIHREVKEEAQREVNPW